ncbi:hypothetical protein CAAU_1025 [Caloramator australicus RC3]|uniref:Uncharacterized protein n=2 Tax=Caloramator australicus RC3 TaxID=857293 RepID=I7K6C2_9CLOT|nr:hypothetical protein CAAU_1025 [Caloramator australicus RC3]
MNLSSTSNPAKSAGDRRQKKMSIFKGLKILLTKNSKLTKSSNPVIISIERVLSLPMRD